MDRDNPGGVTLARPLLAQPLRGRAAGRVRPDRPERPGHSTDPAGPVTVDTPGERSYATGRGLVTTGIPTVSRRPQPDAAPGAQTPRVRPA